MTVKSTLYWVSSILYSCGVPPEYLWATTTLTIFILAVVGALLLYWLLSRPLARIVNTRISKSATKLDDFLFPPKTVHVCCALLVTLIFTWVFPPFLNHYPKLLIAAHKLLRICNIVQGAYLIILMVRGFSTYLNSSSDSPGGALVVRNLLTTVVAVVAGLLVVSILLGRDLAYVISGLGAMAAVLMLVFKDSILGMTAGIRLSLNKMLKLNDWVSVPKYGAEGRVEDLTLTAVKIRNWDQSISSVPPHALISDGFVNHEAMLNNGIRQIKRTFNIDINSLRRLSQAEMSKFEGEQWLFGIDLSEPQVNLKLFRRYLRHFISAHPRTSTRPRFFVKEHPHTESGLPIEVHFFVRCIDWAEFEELQADILDEILASLQHFGLRLFQRPAGHDLLAVQHVAPLHTLSNSSKDYSPSPHQSVKSV